MKPEEKKIMQVDTEKISLLTQKSHRVWQRVTRLLVVVTLFSVVALLIVHDQVDMKFAVIPFKMPMLSPSALPYASVAPDASPFSYPAKIVLQKNGNQDVYMFESYFGQNTHPPIHWKNKLIFYSNGDNPSEWSLKSHDLITGETSILYQEKNPALGLSYLGVIEDTLYFSTGGYLETGVMYYLTSPENQLTKLTSGHNLRISEIGNRWWVRGGEGDGCGGFNDYSLFDPSTKKVTFIARSNEGCSEGEAFLGIDTKGRMLLAGHGHEDTQYDEPSIADVEGVYSYVVAIPLAQPEMKEGVMSKDTVPDDTTKIVYNEALGSLVLIGRSVSLYSLSDNSSKTLVQLPADWGGAPYLGSTEKIICVYKPNSSAFTYGQIEIGAGAFVEDGAECKQKFPVNAAPEPSPANYAQIEVQKLFDELKLPSEYKLVFF